MKKIIADPNIPLLDRFESIGNVVRVPGREWTNDLVRDADILLTRSVTKVNADLLKNSKVKFVGTATSGFDHVDTEFLDQQGIYFSYCPGSNANSVAEYVISALLTVTSNEKSLEGMSVGVIGCGHVGGRVAELLRVIGITTILHDPPLKDQTGSDQYRSLEEALSADIVTLHTPLTSAGKYPTKGLISDQQLQMMKPDVILINAARGGVIDEAALLKRMASNPQMKTVIDCWENEPAVDHDLLRNVTLATPHIAGYSYDGKVKASRMLYESLCNFLGYTYVWKDHDAVIKKFEQSDNENGFSYLRELVFSCYDIRIDDQEMKKILQLSKDDAKKVFDQMRKNYRLRNEFDKTEVKSAKRLAGHSIILNRLGFKIDII